MSVRTLENGEYRDYSFLLSDVSQTDSARCGKGPLFTYAPRGVGGGGKLSHTFPLRITCKKGGGGPDSM